MNLRQLDLFVAVAETKSFSRGAELICLTQSTVSQHIAALEDEVATKLFDRTQKGALLTAGGQQFLQHARRVLAERDLLYQGMASFNGLQEGALRIGASNIPANYLIPAILPRMAEQYPGISLNMQTGDSSEILNNLVDAEVELAVVGNRKENRSIDFTPLTKDTLVLIVGSSHPWRKRSGITLAELVAEPLVVRENGSGSGQALYTELQRLNCDVAQMKIIARLGSNEAVLQAVVAGYGCAFVSQRSVERELAAGELFQVSVGSLRVERQLWLAVLRGRSLSPAASAFSRLLSAAYGPMKG